MIGRVHATPDFARPCRDHRRLITDLMISVFGDAALCARGPPPGMGSSPFRVAIIADAILQVAVNPGPGSIPRPPAPPSARSAIFLRIQGNKPHLSPKRPVTEAGTTLAISGKRVIHV